MGFIMTEHAIYTKDLTKEYQKNRRSDKYIAIDKLNLAVPMGTIFGLLGPNGAGKSTLINILAGTVVKTSGQACIAGVSIDEYPKKARSMIGIVPQEIVFDTFFPLQQGLEFYAGYYGIKPAQRKTEEILTALGLWDKRSNFPQQLSGGMKRRFLIAKAMVHSPKVLVLDEPTAGVDLELRTQLWNYIRELNKQGVTIIITTHYLAEAQELCNEIAFINKGKIIKQSSKDDLLEELGSRHAYVEFDEPINYIGKDNFVEKIAENKLRFLIDKDKGNFNQILKEIGKINVSVKDLRVTQPDLEDIFHQIMKK
jgi:ABC-2 type transport system ATP-binding protein